MRLLLLVALLPSVNACWFYSKESTLVKIKQHLGTHVFIDREYISEMERNMPKIISWAIEQIGVDEAFKDCDANKDGKITVKEMEDTETCLASCTKLTVLNTVL